LKVLVTGASGMVGKQVVAYLSAHGHEPVGTDIVGDVNRGSVTDKNFVFGTLARLDFEAIIHLAGVTDIKKTIDEPHTCYEVNCYGTLNMLELGVRKDVRRFLFASSANIYGAPRNNPVDEHEPPTPRIPYDYSKSVGEMLVRSYHQTKKLPASITRTWLLFGENDLPNRAVPRFISSCLRNEPLTLFNSGRDTTAPSHAVNYARLAATILENDAAVGETFNFGGDRSVSVRELASLIKELTNSSSALVMLPPRSEQEREPQISYPSVEKVKRLLGYAYELSLEEGLKRTIEFYRER
jgi:nucleoside-diphosphate-sugar epimerase